MGLVCCSEKLGEYFLKEGLEEQFGFNPVTSSHQAFLLNKIAIGQFLNMKYKVGKKNNIGQIKKLAIVFEICDLSTIDPVNITKPIVRSNIMPSDLGYEFFRDSPLLFKNPFSLSNVNWEPFITENGMQTNVVHRKNEDKWSNLYSFNIIAEDIPNVIPIPNIKFQKLSLLQRDLIQFIKLPYMFNYSMI